MSHVSGQHVALHLEGLGLTLSTEAGLHELPVDVISYYCNIYCNIILPSLPTFSKWSYCA